MNRFGRELENVIEGILAIEPNINIISDAEGGSVAASVSINDMETTQILQILSR